MSIRQDEHMIDVHLLLTWFR